MSAKWTIVKRGETPEPLACMALIDMVRFLTLYDVYVEMGRNKSRLAFPSGRDVSDEFCSLFTVFAKHAAVAPMSAVTCPAADTWLDEFEQAPSSWGERFKLQAETASRGQLHRAGSDQGPKDLEVMIWLDGGSESETTDASSYPSSSQASRQSTSSCGCKLPKAYSTLPEAQEQWSAQYGPRRRRYAWDRQQKQVLLVPSHANVERNPLPPVLKKMPLPANLADQHVADALGAMIGALTIYINAADRDGRGAAKRLPNVCVPLAVRRRRPQSFKTSISAAGTSTLVRLPMPTEADRLPGLNIKSPFRSTPHRARRPSRGQ